MSRQYRDEWEEVVYVPHEQRSGMNGDTAIIYVPQRAATLKKPSSMTLRTQSWGISLCLFLVTCLSTFVVGQSFYGNGWTYSLGVMSILLAHELGHFLQAVRYRIPATPPFFIPMPFSPLGTMGAVILQDGRRANRKQAFDIAISGPLAGLVIALPMCVYAIAYELQVINVEGIKLSGFEFGEPLLWQWLTYWIHGPLDDNQVTIIGGLGAAAWVGLLVTSLNLIPVGQLDGGHILYGLVGKKAHKIAFALMGVAIVYMIWTQNISYILMLFLVMFFGIRHPPSADDRVALGTTRTILGWLTLAFLVIGFTLNPLSVISD